MSRRNTQELHMCGAPLSDDGRTCLHCDNGCLMLYTADGCMMCARMMQYEELGVGLQTSAKLWAQADMSAVRWYEDYKAGGKWFTHPQS